jgi:hypothetical protein
MNQSNDEESIIQINNIKLNNFINNTQNNQNNQNNLNLTYPKKKIKINYIYK